MAGLTDNPVNHGFDAWKRFQRVASDVTVDLLGSREWKTPLEQLFAGWVHFHAGSYAKAAEHILSACDASVFKDEDGLFEGRNVAEVREWCSMHGYTFYAGAGENDLSTLGKTRTQKLAQILSKHSYSSSGAPESTSRVRGNKRHREAAAEERDPKLKIRHAIAYFRHALYGTLDKSTAKPQLLLQTLLFYADALCIWETGKSMLGCAPLAYFDGPVYSDGRELLSDLQHKSADDDWSMPSEDCVLNGAELRILERVQKSLGTLPTHVLIELTRMESSWAMAVQRAHRTKEHYVELSLEALEEWFRSRLGASVARAIQEWERGNPTLLDLLVATATAPDTCT